jgi:signal transduction histidine kinase
MQKYFRNLPLFRKIILFSFFIMFLVLITTAGISIAMQRQQMKEQLSERVVGLTNLWATTIEGNDVIKAIEAKDKNHPAYKKLYEQVSLIHKKNSPFFHGAIILPKLQNNEVDVVVASQGYEGKGVRSFQQFQASDEYLEAMLKAVITGQVVHSEYYRDSEGMWVTAFSPIEDQKGNIVGILSIAADATVLKSFASKITYYLLIVFLIITVGLYFIFRQGINKTLEPINELIAGFNEVSDGNFNVKLPVIDQSDLGLLFERFNFMTEQLSILFERLNKTSEQLGNDNRHLNHILKFEDAIGEIDHIMQKTKLLKELQRAEKMNAIGQLAASVAHEIRNPMTVVKGFLQIFLSKDELSQEEHMYVKLMIDEMNRAETIINDYLSLAKPDIEQMEKVNGGELTNKVVDLMNSYAMLSKNIELKTCIEENVIIKGNKSELQQVLVNIVKNGIEAMKDGGLLSIRVYKSHGFGIIEIEDTGIGMSREELDRIGTAFYSLKEKGTGMGLLVCYQIIERMKGSIHVKSEKGKGTIFIISIPLEKEN